MRRGSDRCPDRRWSTDLPTRITGSGQDLVQIPFTVEAPILGDHVDPQVDIQLAGPLDVHAAAGWYGTAGRTVLRGVFSVRDAAIDRFVSAWDVSVDEAGGERSESGTINTTVKLRSLLGQRVTRSADTVTVDGSSEVFDLTSSPVDPEHSDTGDRGRPVHLQRYTSTGWTTLLTVPTDSLGHVHVRIRLPFTAAVRLVTPDTTTAFGAVTAAVVL